ncbi:MAG: msrA [Candidatus Kaiserbacteria bacterium]|nr:msrA [Candidatus Kaiserbacteria bacterium]
MTPVLESAVFGGGCFWCTEAVFTMLKGVTKVMPGYTGGQIENPTYDQVCSGKTGHVEVVHITYDPSIVPYKTLLTIFFGSHDPTTPNRQGNDVGTQYRSVVFYTTPEQKAEAEQFISDINASAHEGDPIVTTVEPLGKFYEAEDYHQNYFARNKGASYCQIVINPKLQHVVEEFGALLKTT